MALKVALRFLWVGLMNQYEVQSHVGGFNLQPIQELELIVQVKPIDDML